MLCSVLFFSRPRSEGWPHHGRTFSIYLCSLFFLIDCFTGSPVHVLMSSIQAVRGLPRLRASGIVRCSVRCGRYVRGRCSDTCRMFCWQCYAVSTTAPCSTSTPLTLIVPPSTGILCVAVVTLTLASDAETGCGRAAGSHVVCSRARHSSVTVNKCLTNQTYMSIHLSP